MTQKELREVIGLLTPYKVSELSRMTLKYLALNVELQETRPDRCPKCGAEGSVLIKKGFSRGKQRYSEATGRIFRAVYVSEGKLLGQCAAGKLLRSHEG